MVCLWEQHLEGSEGSGFEWRNKVNCEVVIIELSDDHRESPASAEVLKGCSFAL